ncbi:telomere length regulation protein TEL2 homolog [Macrobrachium rosenbergii]|uniref:telomere length regulation protein TEL2 homolog n=1 Tax=Macrobrachium rosenbergii TaxID=79674 RepID=UPI0034D61DDA
MLNMWKVRELTEKVTNMVMNYTEVEAKVREATNDEAWGPTGPQMQELAQSTFYYEQFPEVMGMLWKRMLQDNRNAWRRTYKSLLLLNYLVRNGSERVVTSAREHIYDLRTLENFKFIDEHGKDQGLNIRMKAKDLIDFIQDDNRLREERKKAKKNKDKYVGVSSDSLGFRGSGQSDWEDWGSSRRKQDDFDAQGGNRFEDSPSVSGDEIEELPEDSPVAPVKADLSQESDSAEQEQPLSSFSDYRVLAKICRFLTVFKPTDPLDLLEEMIQKRAIERVLDLESQVLQSSLPGFQNSQGVETIPGRQQRLEQLCRQREVQNGDAQCGYQCTATRRLDGLSDLQGAMRTRLPLAQVLQIKGLWNITGQEPERNPVSCQALKFYLQRTQNCRGPSSNLWCSAEPDIPLEKCPGILSTKHHHRRPFQCACELSGKNSVVQFSAARGDVDEPERRMHTNDRDDEKESKTEVNRKPQGSDVASLLAEQKRLLKILEMELTKGPPNVKLVRSTLESMLFWLPGEFTPQKYAGVDSANEGAAVFFQYTYGQVLEVLVKNFISDGILRKDFLCKKFVFDFLENGYLEESINCLISVACKAEVNKMKLIVQLLEKLLKSTCLISFLMRYCSQTVDVKGEKTLFDETVRLYVSLPDRIANRLERDCPDFLIPQMFCKITSYHLLQAIYFIASGLHNEVSGNAEPIAKLFGRLCLVSDTEAVLTTMVRWLKIWGMGDMIIQRVVHKMFTHVPDVACERVITTLLKMEVDDMTLYMLLGDCGIKNLKLKYLFTQKLLITRHLPYASSVPTIIGYLGRAQSSHEVLRIVFQQLLDTWSDKSIMAHNSFEHHVYITRGLLTCMVVFTNADVEHCKNEAIQLLLHGVGNHLDVPNHQSKLIGMITAEELTKVFNAGGPVLKFDYEECELTLELKKLVKLSESNKPTCKDNIEVKFNNEWIGDFESELVNIGILKVDTDSKEIKSVQNKDLVPLDGNSGSHAKDDEFINISANTFPEQDNDSDDLDSDDDEFQPYDMSDDTKQIKVKEPSYPQEILDYLIEGEADKVEAALRVSEKIIRREIRKQDSDLAVEMAKVVLHLENKYDIEGFEDNRLNSLVALTSSHPMQCALYLGREFYERNYNIRQRLDMLHALSKSAVELSGFGAGRSSDLTPSKSKKKEVLNKKNEMKEVAGSFFYPLMHGLSFVQPHLDLLGCDRFLLCDLLKTLGLIVSVTGQCELSLKMAGCLLELTWPLRTHEDADVRAACLEALFSGLEVVPDSVLLALVPGEVVELRQWLGITLEKEEDKKCQLLAAKLALKLDKCFKEQIGIH